MENDFSQFLLITVSDASLTRTMKGYAENGKTVNVKHLLGNINFTFKNVFDGAIVLQSSEPLCQPVGHTMNLNKTATEFVWNTDSPLFLAVPAFDCFVQFKFELGKEV